MSRVFGHLTLPPTSLFCIEFLLISSAVLLAIIFRLGASALAIGSGVSYAPHAFLTACTIQLCMYYADLYDFRVGLNYRHLFIKLLQSLAGATVALTVVFYFFPQLTIGRGIMLLSLPMVFGSVFAWRLLYQQLQAIQQFKVKVLIVGTGEEAKKLAGELLRSELPGLEIKGFIGDSNEIGRNVL